MSKNPQIPSSLKKYLRRQKAEIRRRVSNLIEQEQVIEELYRQIKSAE